MGLYDLLNLYREHHPQLAESTAEAYGYAIRSLERHLGRVPQTSDLSETVVLSYISGRLGTARQRTVKRELASLLRLWRFAWRRHLDVADPRDLDLPRIRLDREPPIALTTDDFRRLLESCHQETGTIKGTAITKAAWWYALCLVLYYSTARISAVLAIRQEDLDRQTGLLHLVAASSKTRTGQWVRLPRQAIWALDEMGWAGDPLFPNPYQRRWRWTAWKRILRRAGLPADRYHAFHVIRRTAATFATANGSIEDARRLLGHSTQSQTWGYVDPRALERTGSILPRIG